MTMASEWKGKTVLVTGASYGIGEAFAHELAAGGANLVLTARSADRLEKLAATLIATHAVSVKTVIADLARPDGPETVFQESEASGVNVDLLINNAGFGQVGDFADADLKRQLEMIRVNVDALVVLCHKFLQPMLERQSGAILNVASTASFQAVPYFATYAATKAFVLTFSEALAAECATSGVRVLALCPGRTETNFQAVAGTTNRASTGIQSAAEVVKIGLSALASGRSHVVSGLNNRVMVQVERFLPRRGITKLAGSLYQQFSTRASK
jgi:short-subunit dehydrogenase